MEFLFSSFLGALAASSAAWEGAEAGLLSTAASADLAAAFGSSLAFTAWDDSPAAAAAAAASGAGLLAFLGSAPWKVHREIHIIILTAPDLVHLMQYYFSISCITSLNAAGLWDDTGH